ncbi:peptidylprolyl isomerase [Endozoicomonas sp. (ex Bugula neritina AB1)]|nr:peptidylprolyl isomerase [Endozoicomonas sp. (ex Bugula neritina AB1)]
MKKVFRVSALAAVFMLAAGCKDNTTTTPDVQLNTDEQKAAYSIGASVGNFANQTLKQQDELGVVLDRTLIKQGLLDSLDSKVKLSDEEITTALRAHEERMNKVVQEQSAEKLEATKKAGEEFLTQNAKKEGVKVTDSGLQYEVIKQGEGTQPTAEDTVTVDYTGTLTDGTKFDSSKDRGQPATFPLANVIKGWTEGVALMNEGSEYRLYIPAELGYGDQEVGNIPAGSVLVFDVELINVEKNDADEKKDADTKK